MPSHIPACFSWQDKLKPAGQGGRAGGTLHGHGRLADAGEFKRLKSTGQTRKDTRRDMGGGNTLKVGWLSSASIYVRGSCSRKRDEAWCFSEASTFHCAKKKYKYSKIVA